MGLGALIPLGTRALRRRHRNRQSKPGTADILQRMARLRRARHPQPQRADTDRPVREQRDGAVQVDDKGRREWGRGGGEEGV